MEQFSTLVTGTHDWRLVVLSVVIAIAASYVALDLAGRATAARGRTRLAWLVGGSVGMGIGINSMHFVGMSGYHLPVSFLYHLPTVVVAFLTATFASSVAFIVVTRREMPLPLSLAGSVCMGLGIVAMHYTGVASMRVQAGIHYDALIVTLSVLIALGVSFVALRLAFHLREWVDVPAWSKLGSAALMGLAISSMHYTGMAATSFSLADVPVELDATIEMSMLTVWAVGLVTLNILGFLILLSVINRRLLVDQRERQQAEERLVTRERQLRALVSSLDDIVFEFDEHGTYLNVWAGNERLLAKPKDELLGKRIDEIFGAKEARPFMDAIARAMACGKPQETEFLMEVAEGRRWFLARTNPIFPSGGSATSVSMLVRNVTERKKAECALRESEERLRLSLEAANQGTYDLNVQTGEAQVSPSYAKMLDYDPATFRETNAAWLERLHPQDRQSAETAYHNYLLGRIPEYRVEFRQRTRQGDWRWILSHGRVVERGVDGEPVRMLGTHTDITERKQSEEALRASEERLRQAQKMEAVGRLAGGVAHDFNNLLTVIRGHCYLLAENVTLTDDERHGVGQINEAAERAVSLTSQLLAFSRNQLLQPEVLDLNDVVKSMDKMLRRLIGEDIELMAKPKACGKIYADKGQVEQVLMNLAVNARDAMPRGGQLTISTIDLDIDATFSDQGIGVAPGPHVLLTVSDTGMGMDLATQTRIFEPFFTTKPKGQGTGLGLSTVYGIVKQTDGAISVYSEVGQGTTFKIYLPCVDGAAMGPVLQDDTAAITSGTETILLAEDDEMVRMLTGRVLRAQGYTVHLAESGAAALQIAQECAGRINLLVTDVVMPGISGRELSERLAATHPEAKVLYMSGYTDDAVIRNGVLKEGIAFIQKPYTLTGLLREIREVLDGASTSVNA